MEKRSDKSPSGEDGHVKSILKPKSNKPSATNLGGKFSNSSLVRDGAGGRSASKDPKKKVEITTPAHSSTSFKRIIRNSFKETPLPRVALLPPRPTHLDKLRPKPKTFLSHRASSLKRSGPTPTASPKPHPHNVNLNIHLFPAKTSASTSKFKPNKPISRSNSSIAAGGFKKSKPIKKMKKKKSKSTSDIRSSLPPRHENGGKEYIKELVTINELLKSVTDPTSQDNKGAPLIGGFVRPFSADELRQLLTSVGNVAIIHKNPESLKPSDEDDLDKSKVPTAETPEGDPAETNNSDASSTSKTKKKRRKTKKSVKTKASSSSTVNKRQLNAKGKETEQPKSVPAPGSASKNLASKKTLKSNVKSLKNKGKNSDSNDAHKGQSAEDLQSELSELDLVKSAILNKRYYEESLALERLNSSEDMQPGVKGLKQITKKKKMSKDLRRLKAAHNSAHDLISPVLSRSPSPTGLKKQVGGHHIVSQKPGILPLRPLTPTDGDDAYNKALGNVLINYSHVIRPPTRRGLEHVSSKQRLEHRGVIESERLLESELDDHDKPPTFEKHIQNVKYRGPIVTGMLDIDHVKVPEPPAPGKYTKMNASNKPTREKHTGEIFPTSILVKGGHRSSNNDLPSDVVDQKGVEKSGQSRRRSRNKSRSKSPSQEPKTTPMTAPAVGFHGPLASLDKKVHNATRANPPTHSTPLPRKIVNDLPVFHLIKPQPSRWNDQSIAPSIFLGLPDDGASRWTILNERITEKTQQLKNDDKFKPRGLIRSSPDEGGSIRKRMDPAEQKKLFLQNLDTAKRAFDNFGVHENATERKHHWRPGKAQYANIANTFGLDTMAVKHNRADK